MNDTCLFFFSHYAIVQHHHTTLQLCSITTPNIDDPIVCLQENQLFSIFDFQIKFEISELFRHWGFKSQILFIKSLPTKFFRFRIPLSVEIYHHWKFSDLHVFFLFFFCFSDGENRMIFTLLVVFISLVLKWCSTWGIERFVNFENPFNH